MFSITELTKQVALHITLSPSGYSQSQERWWQLVWMV